MGTPIAAFNNIGISDFLENAKNGNLADAANKDSPAKAIVNCVNKNNWQRLSKNAIQTVLKKYSLNKHINNMEELYDDCYSAKQQEEIA